MRIDCLVKHGNDKKKHGNDKKEESTRMAETKKARQWQKNNCGNDSFVSIGMKKASAIIAVFTYRPAVFRKL